MALYSSAFWRTMRVTAGYNTRTLSKFACYSTYSPGCASAHPAASVATPNGDWSGFIPNSASSTPTIQNFSWGMADPSYLSSLLFWNCHCIALSTYMYSSIMLMQQCSPYIDFIYIIIVIITVIGVIAVVWLSIYPWRLVVAVFTIWRRSRGPKLVPWTNLFFQWIISYKQQMNVTFSLYN